MVPIEWMVGWMDGMNETPSKHRAITGFIIYFVFVCVHISLTEFEIALM